MLKKCINILTKTNVLSKIPKRTFSDKFSDRERAEKKNYILR